ncbi:MAG TPA: DUF4132 domain-containing protein [Acidimicrobiales bacterium]|nr:DUF4132 domain-containing protein [Acidimicrobiales bacterium]
MTEADRDEDAFIVPAEWWRQAEPFRGRGPARRVVVAPSAPKRFADLLVQAKDALAFAFEHTGSDAELAERGSHYLATLAATLSGRATDTDADPMGAAVVGTVLARPGARMATVVDCWVAFHGIAFAAETGVLLKSVDIFNPPRADPNSRLGRSHLDCAVAKAPPEGPRILHSDRILGRLRAHMALCDDESYAAAVERVEKHRWAGPALRIVSSYLFPTEQDWVNQDIASLPGSGLTDERVAPLLASATTVDQAEAILAMTRPWTIAYRPRLVFSLAAHVGPDAAPILARMFDDDLMVEHNKRLVGMLAHFPGDDAFGMLLDRLDRKNVQPALLEAMERFPRRAMRLVSAAAAGSGAKAEISRGLLRGHALAHPDVAAAVRPSLDATAARALDTAVAASTALPAAPADRLPAVLASPPWATRARRSEPVVIEGLGRPAAITLAWRPGEQEEWGRTNSDFDWLCPRDGDWAPLVEKATDGYVLSLQVLALAPGELVRPHLAEFSVGYPYEAESSLRRILGRFGEEAAGLVLRVVLKRPSNLAALLLPYEGSEVAALMATWYATTKSIRHVALAWFDRHPDSAARDLVPRALGTRGKERTYAEAALRLLDHRGHKNAVRNAASLHGPAVVDAIETMLATDPLQLLPARIPTLPSWLDPAHLPQVKLLDRTAALPAEAVGHVLTMAAISKPGHTYAGIELVREAVDRDSLAEMAWAAFERWRSIGFPPKEGWILRALALLGNDETVRRLSPLIRSWPGEAASARAVAALDVLSSIGSDVALMHLHAIAEKARFKGLKTKAKAKIEEVADGLGLTAEQLADRLVPDFGLDDTGSLLLDYGPRRFRVGFDEQLKPVVADEDGPRRKVLPKPGVKDDPVMAGSAYALFTGLKKDVKVVASDQIRRLERAMVAGRRWTAAEHKALFVDHPLLWHLTRRLVWATFDDSGTVTGSFRVAEDRSLADSADVAVALSGDTYVGIAHPLHLREFLGAWSELFYDYEILQPFPQLGREVFSLSEEEKQATLLRRVAGATTPTGRVLALSDRGWERGNREDGGIQAVVYRPVPGGGAVVVNLDPGIEVGATMLNPEQTIAGVWLNDGPPGWAVPEGKLAFGLLDDITASEVMRDLETLRR